MLKLLEHAVHCKWCFCHNQEMAAVFFLYYYFSGELKKKNLVMLSLSQFFFTCVE